MLKFSLSIILLMFFSLASFSQKQDPPSISLFKISKSFVIDGKLDEETWDSIPSYSNFYQYFPFDSSMAKTITEVKITFNDDFLYLGITVTDSVPGEYVSASLRRDYPQGSLNDDISIIFDTFSDQTNGFFFSVNPYNVQREGLIANGGAEVSDLDLSWDNPWYSATSIYPFKWEAEIAIPFNTLRFKENAPNWGINVLRVDSKANEWSVLNLVPRIFEPTNLAFTAPMKWRDQPPKDQSNIVLIPYTAASQSSDNLNNTSERSLEFGGDAKIGITPSLNLDLTINPDFSQIEVDVQQTNLDRFELFFPERRQFFLENADLFANFGLPNARPFFSRRIGVEIDSATGQNVQIPLLGGARLSGKLDQNWRLGILNIQTASDNERGLPGYNYSVASVQRKVFSRSNIGLIYVSKNNFDGLEVDQTNPEDGSSNHLIGVDYNLASADAKWTGKVYYHQSYNEGNSETGISHGANINYNTPKFFASWSHQLIEPTFDAKVGFVPRTDFKRANPVVGYNFFPKSRWINRHQISTSHNWIWNDQWGITDYNLAANWNVLFQNNASFNFSFLSNYVKLFFPFNPTGSTERVFQPGDDFVQTGFLASFQSDRRKLFSHFTQIISGGFYNGNLRQISGNLSYRYRQYATIGINYNINSINLEEGFDDATIYLVGTRLDITFTTKLFWTTFVQYNSQFDNININSRFQWRYNPVSDFFLVYTDNYFPTTFQSKNRAIVAKLTYWLNL